MSLRRFSWFPSALADTFSRHLWGSRAIIQCQTNTKPAWKWKSLPDNDSWACSGAWVIASKSIKTKHKARKKWNQFSIPCFDATRNDGDGKLMSVPSNWNLQLLRPALSVTFDASWLSEKKVLAFWFIERRRISIKCLWTSRLASPSIDKDVCLQKLIRQFFCCTSSFSAFPKAFNHQFQSLCRYEASRVDLKPISWHWRRLLSSRVPRVCFRLSSACLFRAALIFIVTQTSKFWSPNNLSSTPTTNPTFGPLKFMLCVPVKIKRPERNPKLVLKSIVVVRWRLHDGNHTFMSR